MSIPNCPACQSEYAYEDRNMFVCPECGNEWTGEATESTEEEAVVKDSNGNVIVDGDSISVIKDLKVKGSSSAIKKGTNVKNIRLIDPDMNTGHDIECKIDGFGVMKLKSEFVKKI
ncbi:zinc ribbon domain-containing protein YjdM [Vagococcus sp. PNs007]|uniref:Zinc ribbon domain-containing protein YjdM n=1 Tax=Vagococcus proximus TaxID=2991417 RepID=A0ABT5WY55_9ENTE|nr:zinc ribbon domain-containing protein YjdM [Vagococcus proximus]MDF0478690.1 zinc ribbon domain-containing protein YjdM [Vagococcus proximus]